MLSVYWKQSLGQLMVKSLSPWKSLLFPGQEVSEVWREKLTKIAFLSLVESPPNSLHGATENHANPTSVKALPGTKDTDHNLH